MLDKDGILPLFEVVFSSDLEEADTDTVGTVHPRNRDKAKAAGYTKLATS